jgi:hypothetical protein
MLLLPGFWPRAILVLYDVGYQGVQISIDKTDNAFHGSNWPQSPDN